MNNKAVATYILLLIGARMLSACRDGGTPTPAANPPMKGPVELIVDVKDAQGQPVNGAQVLVLASHTTMSGMNQQGPATAQGDGRYAITADMSGINGQWLITIQVSKGSLNLAQDFRIDVK